MSKARYARNKDSDNFKCRSYYARKPRIPKPRIPPTHCPHGHEYSGSNILMKKQHGKFYRQCRECRNIGERLRYRKHVLSQPPSQPQTSPPPQQ